MKVPLMDPWETKRGHVWQQNVDYLSGRLPGWPDARWTDDSKQTLAIRVPGKPAVDFYPSTGRWRLSGIPGPTREGGAAKFWRWFSSHKTGAK